MKKIVLIMMIALTGTMIMNAQSQRHHGQRGHRGTPEQMIEKRVAKLSAALSLTDTQKAEITKIFAEEMESMKQARPEKVDKEKRQGRLDEETKHAHAEKMKAQRQATDARIEALLTPEQAAKYAKIKDSRGKREMGKRHEGRHGDKMKRAPKGGASKSKCCEKKD